MVASSPLGPSCSSPMHQLEEEESPDYASDDFTIDYKRLAIEVATRISPDIQETLADTVTNMFKLQAEGSQHGQRLDELESRVLSWETAGEKMQTHI